MSRRGGGRPRLGALPIILIIAFLLVGTLATTLSIPASSPSPTPDLAANSLPPLADVTAPPTQTPLGRYPASAESGLISSCVAGIDPNTVPGPIAAAFCVCTVNKFEQQYPTYDEFQRATTSGALTDQMKTDISNACAVQIVGG